VTDPQIVHIVGVTAVWTIFLSSIRFALAGFHGVLPVLAALWHLWTCPGRDRRSCQRRFQGTMDAIHVDFFAAVTSPWSVMLLTGGMAMIGSGLAFGSIGDVAQLLAKRPTVLNVFDRATDCLCAALVCTGMAMALAGLSKRRTASTLISLGFILTGAGVGYVTTV
jgi:hypothetical protein